MNAHRCVIFLLLVALAGCSQSPAPSPESVDPPLTGRDHIIVQCRSDCAVTERDLRSLGATTTNRFRNVAALAVTLPAGQLNRLSSLASVKDVAKNRSVHVPKARSIEGRSTLLQISAVENTRPRTLGGQALREALALTPRDFAQENIITNAATLHAAGLTGQGVVVAVIDTGTANNSDIVPALAGSVIGGETFIARRNPATEPSATSTLNDPHGTMTASMIAGHATFLMPNNSDIVKSMNTHATGSIQKLDEFDSLVPMVGTAPEASIYALKVFPADGGGAETTDLLAAMDRAITLKRNFDAGKSTEPVSGDGTENNPFVYDALNVQVVNMSLGGASLFPGFEADDLMTYEMLKAGITVVVSAGNDGPDAMTSGDPATGFGALSVAAANDAIHNRIAIDIDPRFGLGLGVVYRPTDHLQTAAFSSRGPLADGRIGIHLTANGVGNFVQAANGGLYMVDGTSFSAPTVAGAAALLQSAFPDATAAQIREALIRGANPNLLGDGSAAIEQGSGFLDVAASLDILALGTAAGIIPELPVISGFTRVEDNIAKAGYAPVQFTGGRFTTEIKNLLPGQVAHFFVPNPPRGTLTVKLSAVTAELPPDRQNQLPPGANGLNGDRVLLAVTDAPTSFDSWPSTGKIEVSSGFERTYILSAGVARIAVRGLATNAGRVSATLTLTQAGTTPAITRVATGTLVDDETDIYRLAVPRSAQTVKFDLSWNTTWGYYPTHDIDLLLVAPDGFVDTFGATLRNPERFDYLNIMPGNWLVMVDGYMLHGYQERYQLGIADQNGKALPVRARK